MSSAKSSASKSATTKAPGLPKMLHHAAFVTHDTAATVDFYTRVLGLELVSTVIDDRIPSTGDPFPYLHLFFKLGDGSMIAFFESLDLPPAPKSPHPAYDIFNHFAFEVGSIAEVDRWAAHLMAHGVNCVGPTDHGVIYSVYFYDPNGVRLEFTVNTAWKEHPESAKKDIADWLDQKAKARKAGNTSELVKWIKERRANRH
jgi:catechol 2,3-dioxygenase-like lactoylglutathione lyase family enzyme